MYISLIDLGMFILFAIIVVAAIYLIAVLRRILCVLGQVKGILDAHDDDIRETLSVLPNVLANVNELIATIKDTAEQTNSAFGSLQHNLPDTVDDLRDGLEAIVVYAKLIGEVFRAVFSKAA